MSRETPRQLPHPFNRIKIRAIGRKEFNLKQRLRGFSPLLVQRRVMVSSVIRDHDYPTTRTRTDFPEMQQEIEARLGIKASYLTPVDQLSVPQADSTKVSNAPPRRMMQQHRIFTLRRNPHPASRTVLLKVNLIHRPEINALASCQPAEFFLPGPDLQDWHLLSTASVSLSEIRVVGITAGTAEFPISHPTCSSRMPREFYHPKGFLSVHNRPASCATPHRCVGCDPRSIASVDRIAPHPLGRPVRRVQTGVPSTQPFVVHRLTSPKLGDNSFPGQPEEHRGDGDHIEIHRISGSHPVVREQRSPHHLLLVASCHKSIIS